VVVIKDARTNFSELQAELAAGNQNRLVYYAFDLLYLNGFDLRRSPQIERKRLLRALLDGHEGPVLYSEHLVGVGQEMFAHAAKLNWEGIVSKNADAPYRSDRNEAWLKIKTSQRAKFPVIGFVKDPTGVAALYLGKREGKDLVYMGKVGTGWSRTVSSQIRKQLNEVVTPKSKLTKPMKKGDLGRAQVPGRSRIPRHYVRRAATGGFVQGAVKELTGPPATPHLRHVFERSHRRDNVLRDIGLRNKKRVCRDFQRPNLTGGDDDVDGRPPIPDRSREFQSVHRARHIDIGEYEVDVLAGFENSDRLGGIVRNSDGVSGLFEFFRDEFPDQGLIFDN
jgi:hypothetical protein